MTWHEKRFAFRVPRFAFRVSRFAFRGCLSIGTLREERSKHTDLKSEENAKLETQNAKRRKKPGRQKRRENDAPAGRILPLGIAVDPTPDCPEVRPNSVSNSNAGLCSYR